MKKLEPGRATGTEPGQAAVTANRVAPRSAVVTTPGRPAGAVRQTQQVFHELHADGRNVLCAVCDVQYGSA